MIAAFATAVLTAVLLLLRPHLDQSHCALLYLLLVLGSAAYAGHRTGVVVACVSFLLFDWFFVPPYNTLAVAHPADWMVLFTFLIVSIVAAELVRRLRAQGVIARSQATEIDRLATVAAQNAVFASVSHDLRTPLTTITALSHELAVTDPRAATIREEADRLNRLVGDLLDLSRVHAGPAATQLELNAVDDLIGAVLQRVSGAMPSREIDVQMEEGGTLLVGRCDFGASIRVVANLLENADKYSPPNERITLTTRRVNRWIEIAVRDHGPGVPYIERESIFEPFRRGAVSRDSTGSGLGLAIARGLARAQGGDVQHAEAPGGGSVFSYRFAAADLPNDWNQR